MRTVSTATPWSATATETSVPPAYILSTTWRSTLASPAPTSVRAVLLLLSARTASLPSTSRAALASYVLKIARAVHQGSPALAAWYFSGYLDWILPFPEPVPEMFLCLCRQLRFVRYGGELPIGLLAER